MKPYYVVPAVCAVTGAPNPANGDGEVLRHTLDTLYLQHREEVEAHLYGLRNTSRLGVRR